LTQPPKVGATLLTRCGSGSQTRIIAAWLHRVVSRILSKFRGYQFAAFGAGFRAFLPGPFTAPACLRSGPLRPAAAVRADSSRFDPFSRRARVRPRAFTFVKPLQVDREQPSLQKVRRRREWRPPIQYCAASNFGGRGLEEHGQRRPDQGGWRGDPDRGGRICRVSRPANTNFYNFLDKRHRHEFCKIVAPAVWPGGGAPHF